MGAETEGGWEEWMEGRAKIETCENERDKSGMRNEERDGWSGKWRFTELYTEQRNEK